MSRFICASAQMPTAKCQMPTAQCLLPIAGRAPWRLGRDVAGPAVQRSSRLRTHGDVAPDASLRPWSGGGRLLPSVAARGLLLARHVVVDAVAHGLGDALLEGRGHQFGAVDAIVQVADL